MTRAAPSRLARALIATSLALGFLLAALAVLGVDPARQQPKPLPPLVVQGLATPGDARAAEAPRGGRIGVAGRLTILSVPGTPGQAEPWSAEPRPWRGQAQASAPVPPAMLRGIRALFRVVPPPPDEDEELRTRNLDRRISQGRLLLVDGCLRFGSPEGPLAVFPPATELRLKDGYLAVGPPGLPPGFSARIGEEVFWESDPTPITDAGSLRRIARHCGPGQAILVLPYSATVQQAANDRHAASEWMRTYGEGDWRRALAAVRACRERLARSAAEQFPEQPRRTMVDNMCGNMPPPVVTDPAACSTGTELRAGVCVTPEGYRRPVPGFSAAPPAPP